jgi:hypothetical protein
MFKGYLLPINFRTKIPFWFQKTTYKFVILIIIMRAPMEENFIYRIIINKSKTCNHFWIKTNNNKNPSKLKDFIFGFTFKITI